MERKRGIIMSYHAPDRNYIWLDPSVNMFKNFEDGLWKPVATNIAYSKIEKLIVEQLAMNVKLDLLEKEIEEGAPEVLSKVGDLSKLDTYYKTNLVSAINELNTNILTVKHATTEDNKKLNTRVSSLEEDVEKAMSKIDGKQDQLFSGQNIKTINGESVLGRGDLKIEGGGTGDYNLLLNKPFEWSTVQIKHPTTDGIVVDVPYVILSELSGGVDFRDTSAIVFSDTEEDLANILDKKADKDDVEIFEEEVRTALDEDSGKIVKYCTINDIDNIPAIASDVAAMKSAVRKGTCMNYIVLKKKSPSRTYVVGTIEMFIDDMEHCITLIFRTNYTLTEDGQIDTGHSHLLSEYVRYYNLSWDGTDYYEEEWPIGTWTKWKNIKNI